MWIDYCIDYMPKDFWGQEVILKKVRYKGSGSGLNVWERENTWSAEGIHMYFKLHAYRTKHVCGPVYKNSPTVLVSSLVLKF